MLDYRQLFTKKKTFYDKVSEELITLRTHDFPFTFPINALLDEIYMKITINNPNKEFTESFYFRTVEGEEPISIEIANKKVYVDDANTEQFSLNTSINTEILGIKEDVRYGTFRKVNDDLYFFFRLDSGLQFFEGDSFFLQHTPNPINFSYPLLTCRFLFSPTDIFFKLNENNNPYKNRRKLIIKVLPVSYDKPYIVITPTTGVFNILKAYYFNVWRIWKVQMTKELFIWKNISYDEAVEYYNRGVELLFDTVLPSPEFTTEPEMLRYQRAFLSNGVLFSSTASPFPYYKTNEFIDLRKITINQIEGEKLLLYAGRFGENYIPFVVLIFEVEEVENV